MSNSFLNTFNPSYPLTASPFPASNFSNASFLGNNSSTASYPLYNNGNYTSTQPAGYGISPLLFLLPSLIFGITSLLGGLFSGFGGQGGGGCGCSGDSQYTGGFNQQQGQQQQIPFNGNGYGNGFNGYYDGYGNGGFNGGYGNDPYGYGGYGGNQFGVGFENF